MAISFPGLVMLKSSKMINLVIVDYLLMLLFIQKHTQPALQARRLMRWWMPHLMGCHTVMLLCSGNVFSWTTTYAVSEPLHSPHLHYQATQCTEQHLVHTKLLRNDQLSLLYTGLYLDAFQSLADALTAGCISQLHPKDKLLMTPMKLWLNLLQDVIAERFRVSQSVVSRVSSQWLDLMEEKMRCYVSWLPRETIQATMPQSFKEHYPLTTCVIAPLQKAHNLECTLRGLFAAYRIVSQCPLTSPWNLTRFLVCAGLCHLCGDIIQEDEE